MLTYLHSMIADASTILFTTTPLRTTLARVLNDDIGDFLGGSTALICCLAFFALNIALLVWVIKDANSRGTSAGAWLIIVLIFGILGLLAYLVARPQGRLINCPNCGMQRPITSLVCPHCGYRGEGIPKTQ